MTIDNLGRRSDVTDSHFSQFATSLSARLAKYDLGADLSKHERNLVLLAVQRDQLTRLLAAESRFRDLLIEAKLADGIYTDFLTMIRREKRNILAARSYFRERQKVFTGGPCEPCSARRAPLRTCGQCHGTGKIGISAAISANQLDALMRYHPNVQFIQFAMRSRRWTAKTEQRLARYDWWNVVRRPVRRAVKGEDDILTAVVQVFDLRNEIVESNIPLVIERALLFGRRTPPSHLTRMDLVQIAADGLMAGVDKLVLEAVGEDGSQAAWDGAGAADEVEFTKEPGSCFRSVAIGRMVGNLIEKYSETLIHFYPGDKRKLYRANKATRCGIKEEIDFDVVANTVNQDPKTGEEVPENQRTSASEIVDLMGAASCVSMVDEEGIDQVSSFAADDSWRPDRRVERAQALERTRAVIRTLPLLERKFLALIGISF